MGILETSLQFFSFNVDIPELGEESFFELAGQPTVSLGQIWNLC